ncbi:MAG: phosphotriesterase [Actinomycetota bacterium]
MSEGSIRTVLGDIPAEALGPTHCHEHVLFLPAPRFGEDLVRTEEDLATAELGSFQEAGGSGLIDATVAEHGRDAAALERVSVRSGIHVVAATGHTAQEWWREEADPSQLTRDDLIAGISANLTVGIGDTGVRAGVVKVGSSRDTITPAEKEVMRAAATVHRELGAPITTHTTAGTHALEQTEFLLDGRVDPSRLCIGHVDCRMVWGDHRAIAGTGVYVGYDQIGREGEEADRLRAEYIARLVGEGFADRILLGSDLAGRSDLSAWQGSPGLAYLLDSFVPLLERHGLGSTEISRMLVENPRRFLAWV